LEKNDYTKSKMTFWKEINALKAKRRYWEGRLRKVIETMSPITVTRSLHVCGNPKCKRCREQGGKHGPFLYATYKDNKGKTHTFYVSSGLEGLADEAHKAWLDYKEIGRRIGEINRQILFLRIKEGRRR
jgi:hypothetical protein